MSIKIITTNRKAFHDYFILKTFEAGVSLHGTEIKSIRENKISIKEAYIKVEDTECWLINSHISPYAPASIFGHDPTRKRKLLLHYKEIIELEKAIRIKGKTIIPLRVYLKDGLAKIEIGIAQGKKLYDKRRIISKRDQDKEIARNFSQKLKNS